MAEVWACYLAHIPPGREAEVPLAVDSATDDGCTEELLYRLQRLGVLEEYQKEGGFWQIIIHPHDRARLEACSEDFLGRVLHSEADVAAWMRELRVELDLLPEAGDQVVAGLRLAIRAHYEIFARRRWQMDSRISVATGPLSSSCSRSRRAVAMAR